MQILAENRDVQAIFDAYPDAVRAKLTQLRELIVTVVSENPNIGELEETLKWGQISYLPKKRKVGTTIRIDQVKNSNQIALYVPCSTTLIDTYRTIYGDDFSYDGDRAILLNLEDDLPVDKLKICIELALTYHLRK
ncbi:MAG: DUF1801 domain-containing protein [Phototrophicaceae bacterium]